MKGKLMKYTALLPVLLLATAAPAFADDAEAGAKVFNKCKACHAADEEKNKVGPHLVGIIDRPVASVEGFKYSDAMKALGEAGDVWSVEALTEYLRAPKKVVPGTKMAFAGLRKEEDEENLIAYFESLADD